MTMSRKELERKQRRQILLDAAERVFGTKPFDQATMQLVAAEAEIGMQGLYEHFPSKQALYEEVILQRTRNHRKQLLEMLENIRRPVDKLRAIAETRSRMLRERPAFFPIFLRERLQFDWGYRSCLGKQIHTAFEEERVLLREIMEEAITKEELRAEDPDFLVQFFLNVLQASLYYSCKCRPTEETTQCADRTMAAFLQGAAAGS